MTHGEWPWMELPQSAQPSPMPDRSFTQAQLLQLLSPHHSVLPISQLSECLL